MVQNSLNSIMEIVLKVLVILVAMQHLFFFWMETFAWTSFGRKTFGGKREYFEQTKSLAANQGVYNAFLSAGLIWSLLVGNLEFEAMLQVFFFVCVVVAGIVGAITVSKKIFWIQSLPALLGLLFLAI